MLSSNSNYSTLDRERSWEDLCIQLRNQQTYTFDNHNLVRGGPILNPVFGKCFIVGLLSNTCCAV